MLAADKAVIDDEHHGSNGDADTQLDEQDAEVLPGNRIAGKYAVLKEVATEQHALDADTGKNQDTHRHHDLQ